ncbi:putative G-patch domain protein [Taphrina deformans PYCC 5710]|uniref:G-patch domain protein n=1 Tax=Taphrina deformans (strain PYCC 5710 / ATCC 11124 / CBS 356.35 / IMI 108563 / JCM 9778 / NBRC 8474) TaxID=1097556 RepID=R4XCX8_TAPDE|nr:putative G-patch domain protein [Taphrina deformans PYCC 5710]|eukprot:CCG83659.1 putative G-patch domain protein [Taphrina deformans PYCC 5710]
MTLSDSSSDEDYDAEAPRKRRKQTKEDRMLGIFGSESDEQESRGIYGRTLHTKGVAFQRAGAVTSDNDEDPDEGLPPSFEARPFEFASSNIVQGASRPTSHSTDHNETGQMPKFESPMVHGPQSDAANYTSRTQPTATKPSKAGPPLKLGNSKAAQMMARMGYKAGEGLGTSGKGIVNPIEAHLRPGQKAGLGSVNEQPAPEQSTRDDRYSKVSKPRHAATSSTSRSRKVKYKTAQEIINDAGGDLKIPKSLQSIIDMTGGQPKRLTSASNIEVTQVNSSANQTFRISQIARKEVEQYAADWQRLQNRKAYLSAELSRSRKELIEAVEKRKVQQDLLSEAWRISSPSSTTHDQITDLNRLVHGLQDLRKDFGSLTSTIMLDEVVVSLLAPVLKQCIFGWEVLSEPSRFVPELKALFESSTTRTESRPEAPTDSKRKSSPFDSLMVNIWFPRIRSTLIAEDISSDAVLNLLEAWAPLTPSFLRDQIINQLVMPRLTERIQKWNPRTDTVSNTLLWLFQWLPYLADHFSEVSSIVKRKFNLVLSQWKPEDGLIRDLHDWTEIIGPSEIQDLLAKQVLPKLADALRHRLVINPSDQKLEALTNVLIWRHNFAPMIMADLLKDELFPKWIQMLYDWLRNNPNLEEVSEWYEWWQNEIPDDLRDLEPVRDAFSHALRMMEITLDRGTEYLERPAVGPRKPLDHKRFLAGKTNIAFTKQYTSAQEEPDITFKDVLDDWCEKHNCLLVPLRRAHESGNALYRITASTTGTGGAIIYLRGDIVMLQDKEQQKFLATSLSGLAKVLNVNSSD